MLYRRIDMPSDEPVQFVGCYVLRWGKVEEPSVGFAPLEDDEDPLQRIAKLETLLKEAVTWPHPRPLAVWLREAHEAVGLPEPGAAEEDTHA